MDLTIAEFATRPSRPPTPRVVVLMHACATPTPTQLPPFPSSLPSLLPSPALIDELSQSARQKAKGNVIAAAAATSFRKLSSLSPDEFTDGRGGKKEGRKERDDLIQTPPHSIGKEDGKRARGHDLKRDSRNLRSIPRVGQPAPASSQPLGRKKGTQTS